MNLASLKMFKFVGLLQFICVLQNVYRSVQFERVNVDGSQLSLLERYQILETRGSSVVFCATMCTENQSCLSFSSNISHEICQLFGRGIDNSFGKSSTISIVYTKKVTCGDFGYISLKTTNKCLKKFDEVLSWIKANDTCVSDGGHLFSITSNDILEEVINLTIGKDSSDHFYHIDGNDINHEGTWVNYDGSTLSFSHWGHDQPQGGLNENCLILYSDRRFHDVSCNLYESKFVCEKHLAI